MKNYFINLLMLMTIGFESYSMKRDRIESNTKIQQFKYKRSKLDQNQNEQGKKQAISEDIMAKFENEKLGFLDLPMELQYYIFLMLLPDPSYSAQGIIAKLRDVITFLSSCRVLKETFENILISHVKKNINAYKNVKSYDQDLLALACNNKRYAVAAMLSRLGFSLDSQCSGCTRQVPSKHALFKWAIANGHPDIFLKSNMSHKAKTGCVMFNSRIDKFGNSCLHSAANNSDEVCVSMILAFGLLNVNDTNNYGDTPLYIAIQRRHLGIVKLLANAGADINTPKGKGWFRLTPLHVAIAYGHSKIVQYLIDNNAKVNERTCYGLTPLLLAILASNGTDNPTEIIEILKDNGAEKEDFEGCDIYRILYIAIYFNWLESVRLLLKKGPLIEDKIWMNGESFLSYALNLSKFEIAKLLIDTGVDLYEKKEGESLLLQAINAQNIEQCNFLLRYDIDHRLVNEPNNRLQTPLMRSCSLNNLEISDILVKNGAKVECRDESGCLALEYAIESIDISKKGLSELTKQCELIKFLLNNGSSVNGHTGYLSPLMITVLTKKMFIQKAAIVDLLLRYGADIYQENSNGHTAWDIAATMHDHEMMTLLEPKKRFKK